LPIGSLLKGDERQQFTPGQGSGRLGYSALFSNKEKKKEIEGRQDRCVLLPMK
jgi:hypothetical protein